MKQKKKWYYLLLLAPAGLLLDWVTRNSSWIAEQVFAKNIYRFLSELMRRLTGWIPFSLMELEIILVIIGGIAGTVMAVRWIVVCAGQRKNPWPELGRAFLKLCCLLSTVYFVFVLTCGINYNRYTFAEYSGLEIRDSSLEELEAAAAKLAVMAGELRALLQEDENGVVETGYDSYGEMADGAREAMGRLGDKYEVLDSWYPRTKPVFFSEIMSMGRTTGIFWGFTMEANVNRLAPDYTIPATMCHELSHLQGFMREDEANYIAYAACMESEDPLVQYSGVMLALVYTGNRLYAESPEAYMRVRELYSDGVIRDLQADNAYWEPYRNTEVSKVLDAANDAYLKTQHQEDGNKSYGRMVDLILAHFRTEESD